MPQCPCKQCSRQIEYPVELEGQEIACPICGKQTRLQAQGTPNIKIPKFNRGGPITRSPGAGPVGPLASKLIANIEKVIVGKREKIMLTLAALLAEGHVLLEDVPGVAKTMLARSLAQSIG